MDSTHLMDLGERFGHHVYFYKNTNVLVLDGSESEGIKQLGDIGGDDVGVLGGSFMGQLKEKLVIQL